MKKEIPTEAVRHERDISNTGRQKLDFSEIDQCKPVLLGLSLAGNLVKPLLSLYGTEWRERGYGLWMDGVDKLQLKTWPMGQFFSLPQTYFYSFLVLWAFVHVILGNPETLYNLNFICTKENIHRFFQ